MTGPSQAFVMGQEVEIIGPSCAGNIGHIGERFKIIERSPLDREEYSTSGLPWYPASSLLLVPTFKKGDWAEITGPSILGDDKHLGEKFVISGLSTVTQHIPFSPYDGMYYPAKSLRKLTPEEVAKHTAPKLELSQETKEKIAAVFENAVEREIVKRYPDIESRLAAIGSRLKNDRNLMMEIEERFDERQDAIEKRQAKIDHWMDRFAKAGARWENFIEAIQKNEVEYMPDCKPIRIIMFREGKECATVADCPAEALAWCQKVLDGMRSA